MFIPMHGLQRGFARIAFFRHPIQAIKRGWVAPLRVRGLKQQAAGVTADGMSRTLAGAWIETAMP